MRAIDNAAGFSEANLYYFLIQLLQLLVSSNCTLSSDYRQLNIYIKQVLLNTLLRNMKIELSLFNMKHNTLSRWLDVVLYGCETWSLTLREERKPKVFENMVLRRIFGPRRDEVTG